MQNLKLTPKQESFVKLANDEGFTTEITKKIFYLYKVNTVSLNQLG